MQRCTRVAAVALVLVAGCHRPAATSNAAVPDPTLYALGALLGRNLEELHLSDEELASVKAGLADQALGAPAQVDLAVYGPKAEQLRQTRRSAALVASAQAQRAKDAPFLEAAAKAPDAQTFAHGLIVRPLSEGSGPSPHPGDRVRVTYRGTLADGTLFDSSDKRGGEVRLPLNGAIPCWSEGLPRMKVGERAQLVCPPELSYGDRGRLPAVPPGATLVFEIALLEVNPPEPPPPPRSHAPAPKQKAESADK